MEEELSSSSAPEVSAHPNTTDLTVPVVGIKLGKTRTCAGLHWKELLFLCVTSLNLIATVALTVYRLVVIVQHKEEASPDFTFAILILINAGFCLFYAFHGVLREISYELYALVAAIVVVVVYCILEYSINAAGRTDIKLARLIAAAVLAPPNIALAIMVTREFGWLEFRIVGASETLQSMYEETVRLSCLLQFDFQVSASIVVLVLRNGTNLSPFEIAIIAVGLPYCLMWAVFGWLAMRHERMWMIWTLAVLGFAEPAYVVYKIYVFSKDIIDSKHGITGDYDYQALNYSILAACIISVLVHILVYVETYRVARNFGQGLKERAFSSEASDRNGLLSTESRR